MNRCELTDPPFRDVSNLRTQKPNPKSPVPLLFTASKTALPGPTPTPLGRRRPRTGAGTPTPVGSRRPLAGAATPLARRLRALELDQSRSARRAECGRERALRAFAASASSWLSLLLRDPSACGCSPAASPTATRAPVAGKRDSLDGARAPGSSPKRHRGRDRCGERRKAMTPAMEVVLRDSLREVCSLDDVKERMDKYMSTDAREEVLVMMCRICKNIDGSRLKMKAHCPIVTDLRLKENAIRIFMCYNPEWLRIGLHIVLGGDCLLQNGLRKQDKEVPFLKLILEKQLFGQLVAPKTSAQNKLVERLHRTGYTEALGNIILKRLFLLVAALDSAKMESAIPLESGIDSLDGGSPPLFCHQSHIKSSRQISRSLGEAMHGEGDLLMHLSSMGYILNYQQLALSEYDFTIGNLFEDLLDGIILCRVVHLLLSDTSIILKVIAPSDTHKKKLHNCTMAIQYIKKAGVPISDADGVTISAEDITNGDKELILSLLWNIFIHMQLPLLANKTSLARELSRLKAPTVEQPVSETKSHMGLLYDWFQVVCEKYDINVETSSKIDRRALNYFINYYLNIGIQRCPPKETFSDCRKELFGYEQETFTDTSSCPTNKMEKVLGDFLQDSPASGILASDILFDEKGAVILIAFLCSHLTSDKRLEQLRNLTNARLDHQSLENKVSAMIISLGKNDVKYQSPQRDNTDNSCTSQERAATIIQTQVREIIAKNKYLKIKKSIAILQGAMRAWSSVIMKSKCKCQTAAFSTRQEAHGNFNRYFTFMLERHRFVRMRRSAIVIQQAVRIWIRGRKRLENIEHFETSFQNEQPVSAQVDFLLCKDVMAARKIQFAYRRYVHERYSRMSAAIKIQSHWRGFTMRMCFTKQVEAIIAIQSVTRHNLCHWAFQQNRGSTIVIQRFARGFLARKRLLGSSLQAYKGTFALDGSQHERYHQRIELKIVVYSILRLQRWWREVLLHRSIRRSVISIQSSRRWRKVMFLESRKRAAIIIQSHVRCWIAQRAAFRKKKCITVIQAFIKAYHVRKASKKEVADIRSRIQKASSQIDDGMRLLNRLIAALSQISDCRSISSIRQTCTTLSFATELSEKCCETLVGAGAVDILLKQIPKLNRGIPDQEVLKQVLITLRNIARFPNLRPVLANTPQLVNIIFQELLRNEEDGFFIACGILKNLCQSKEGHEITAGVLQHRIKRLCSVVEDLEKKVEHDKRNGRTGAKKEDSARRRLGEAASLYHLLTDDFYDL
ncbi:hypothetical protein BRADI_1g26170v3, partial [Brachypodium distachyon]